MKKATLFVFVIGFLLMNLSNPYLYAEDIYPKGQELVVKGGAHFAEDGGRVAIGVDSDDYDVSLSVKDCMLITSPEGRGDYMFMVQDQNSKVGLFLGEDGNLPELMRFRPFAPPMYPDWNTKGIAFTNSGDQLGLMISATSGFVGMGQNSDGTWFEPEKKLHVKGDVKIEAGATGPGHVGIGRDPDNAWSLAVDNNLAIMADRAVGEGDWLFALIDEGNTNGLFIGTDGNKPNVMRIRPMAGPTSPGYDTKGIAISNAGDRFGVFVDAASGYLGVWNHEDGPTEYREPTSPLFVGGNVHVFQRSGSTAPDLFGKVGICKNPRDFSDNFKLWVEGDAKVNGDIDVTGRVAADIRAKDIITGDITFQKDGKSLWRMFEDENGLYVESLKTGKKYKFALEEVE